MPTEGALGALLLDDAMTESSVHTSELIVLFHSIERSNAARGELPVIPCASVYTSLLFKF